MDKPKWAYVSIGDCIYYAHGCNLDNLKKKKKPSQSSQTMRLYLKQQ